MNDKNMIAHVDVLWESDMAKEMGQGLDGVFAHADIFYTADQLEEMLQQEDSCIDTDHFFNLEKPDMGDDYDHMVLKMAIETVENLPEGLQFMMGTPSSIVYHYGEWAEEEGAE